MTRREQRRRWLKRHKRYETIGQRILRKGFRLAAQRINLDSLNEFNFRTLIAFNMGEVSYLFVDLYERVGVAEGKKVGRQLNREIREQKNFDPKTFEYGYREMITRWLIVNGGERITSVRDELIEHLIKFIAARLQNGGDMQTIVGELKKYILSRGFYRWQIERIVRTETTAAANFGAIQAGNNANIIWEKVWISSRDSRTRRRPEDAFDHFEIDGMRVAKGEKFNVQGDLLEYPGDPKGQPANVINCRCAVSVVPKRDSNGKIIFTNRARPQQ